MKRFLRSNNWKYVIAFLVPMLTVLAIGNVGLDNDSWGVLAEGRQILESGLYHEDMLSMHEGLHVVIQNYGFSVLFYLIYSAFGPWGIYLVMLLMNFVVLFLLYKICMLISDKNIKLSLILMSVTGVILAFEFIVTRAQMIDYIVFLALIYVLELFIKTGKPKYLWWIPVFSLILANFHASVWWIIFAIMMAYMVDAIRCKYRMKPLVVTMMVGMVVGVINPYGTEMLVSIFTAYGGLSALGFVSELEPFNPMMGYNLVYYLALVAVFALYAFGRGKNVRLRFLLMLFGFLMMGLSSAKGMSEVILVLFFPLALVYRNWRAPKVFGGVRLGGVEVGKAMTMWVGVVIVGMTLVLAVAAVDKITDGPGQSMVAAVDAIDAEIGNRDKKTLKVYAGYNTGGYVEYRGYPAFLDPRGAEFLEEVNGKADILPEWIDVIEKRADVAEFLSKYDFDFLLAEEYESGIYDLEDERYELMYEGGEHGERVYKRTAN